MLHFANVKLIAALCVCMCVRGPYREEQCSSVFADDEEHAA